MIRSARYIREQLTYDRGRNSIKTGADTRLLHGPFAETREQLGGNFLIDAKDCDEAIHIAARIPGARIGTVEGRPVTEVEGLPES